MRADDCISRKQAIKRLNLNFPSSEGADNSRNRHRYMQALADLQAIRELPSVTPQLSSELAKNSKKLEKNFGELDCIDRAELLKAMDTWDKFGNDPNEGQIPLRTPALQDRYVPYVKYDDMVNCVKGMPSVAPQPKTGHWITKPNVYGVTYCSECDFELKIDNTNYCPNCGCRMVEPQESEVEE